MCGAHRFNIALLCVVLSRDMKSICFFSGRLLEFSFTESFSRCDRRSPLCSQSPSLQAWIMDWNVNGKCCLINLYTHPCMVFFKWSSNRGQETALLALYLHIFEGEVGAGRSQRSWGCCQSSRGDQFAVRHHAGLIYCVRSAKFCLTQHVTNTEETGQVNLHIKPLMIEFNTSFC